VSATAALILASRVLGAHPSPDAITRRLIATARRLGSPGYNTRYGWGLIDAGAATDPHNRAGLPGTPAGRVARLTRGRAGGASGAGLRWSG
jgi:hypothetical protein